MPRSKKPPEAAACNKALITVVQKRAGASDAVLGPSLADYERRLAARTGEHPLHDLTRHLVGTLPETAAAIRERMEAKWKARGGTPANVESSVTNSLRRSAGTNYQSLVSYAIARYLLEHDSQWYVVFPMPSAFAHSLAIRFTAGVTTPDDEAATVVAPDDATTDPEEAATVLAPDDATTDPEEDAAAVTVKPDVDILIRNASWRPDGDAPEPVLLLSVKTSLADRAGAAARWKTYFDLVTRPCAHVGLEDCAYRRLGIELAHDPHVSIAHGIVTANIYKINSDEYFAKYGELRSNQARANTFMFDLRYTTRNDSADVMAAGWSSLTELPDWLATTAAAYGLQP